MEYRIRSNGSIKTLQEIRDSVNVLLPAVLQSPEFELLGIDPILAAPQPQTTSTQYCVRDGCVQDVLGNWVYAWKIIDYTQEQLDLMNVKYVPESVAMWQARDILIEQDMLDDVELFMQNIPDPVAKKRALSKWEFSNTVRRDDPLVNLVCSAKGWTKAQIDDLFIEASKR